MKRRLSWSAPVSLGVIFGLLLAARPACAAPDMPAKKPSQKPPTVAEARAFLDEAEQKLLALSVDAGRAGWVQSTYITDDTEILAAQSNERQIAATVAYAKEATRFDKLKLPAETARKLKLLKLLRPQTL